MYGNSPQQANCLGAKQPSRGLQEEYPEDCATMRETEVTRALSDLHSVIQRYDHLVGRLHSRLNSVIIPAPPAVCNDKISQGYQTDLANTINSMRCQARDISDSLESLLERIEL